MSNEARPSKNVKHCEYNYDKIHNNDNNNNEKNKKEWLGLQRLAVISPSLLITFPCLRNVAKRNKENKRWRCFSFAFSVMVLQSLHTDSVFECALFPR